eukprot:s1368_g2.t3
MAKVEGSQNEEQLNSFVQKALNELLLNPQIQEQMKTDLEKLRFAEINANMTKNAKERAEAQLREAKQDLEHWRSKALSFERDEDRMKRQEEDVGRLEREVKELHEQNLQLLTTFQQFKSEWEVMRAENQSLQETLAMSELSLDRASEEKAQIMGHVNPKWATGHTMAGNPWGPGIHRAALVAWSCGQHLVAMLGWSSVQLGPKDGDERCEAKLTVVLRPGGGQNCIDEVNSEVIFISVGEPNKKGRANSELLGFVASILELKEDQVKLEDNVSSKSKTVLLCGLQHDKRSLIWQLQSKVGQKHPARFAAEKANAVRGPRVKAVTPGWDDPRSDGVNGEPLGRTAADADAISAAAAQPSPYAEKVLSRPTLPRGIRVRRPGEPDMEFPEAPEPPEPPETEPKEPKLPEPGAAETGGDGGGLQGLANYSSEESEDPVKFDPRVTCVVALRQKIRHMVNLKEENKELREQLKKAKQRITQLGVSRKGEGLLEALACFSHGRGLGADQLSIPASACPETPGPASVRGEARTPRRPTTPSRKASPRRGNLQEEEYQAWLAEEERRRQMQERAVERVQTDFQHFIALIERAFQVSLSTWTVQKKWARCSRIPTPNLQTPQHCSNACVRWCIREIPSSAMIR